MERDESGGEGGGNYDIVFHRSQQWDDEFLDQWCIEFEGDHETVVLAKISKVAIESGGPLGN